MSDEPEDEFNDEFEDEEEEALFPTENTAPQQSPLETTSLSDIPFKMHLEVGRLNVSLEELRKMGPGHKLPIEVNPWIVHLTIDGHTIGKAEVVEVGDTIGVKILELYR